MKVLITGGSGFIGGHAVRRYLRDGWDVINLDKLTYASNPAQFAELPTDARYRFVEGDICDFALVSQLVGEAELVLNFAAETHVDRSLLSPAAFVRANVEGVVTLLEAIRANPQTHLVHMSTDEVFGSIDEPLEATEDTPFAPSSPYSASKAGAELQIQAYRRTHGMPVTVVRSTNVYGPHQHLEKFIPLFTARAMTRERLPLYGDGLQQREWLHADDLMDAIQAVVRSDGAGSTVDGINIGSGVRHTNLDLARRICDLTERPYELINHVTDRAGHDRRYALDASRIRALGWEPRTNFDDGFADTVRWYAEHAAARAQADPALADYMKAQYAERLAGANAAAG